jgi:molybdenum cofactor cytidylyltransferase
VPIRIAAVGCDVQFAHNAEYESGGMLSSVKTGMRAIANNCDAFFLVLGDQPLVHSSTYRELLDTCPPRRVKMVQPTFDTRRGHPVLFSSNGIDEILSLPADATLKTYTHRIPKLEVPVDDPGVLADIDTPDDYDRAVLEFQAHRSATCSK